MTVAFGGCMAICTAAKCALLATTGTSAMFTASVGVASSWANPRTCVF
jgi:hypothetical protein